MKITWDEAKRRRNREKHGVDFEEAQTVFGDPLAETFYDESHSDDEPRFLLIGKDAKSRFCLVVYAPASLGDLGTSDVRIISARKATRREQTEYEEGHFGE